MAESVLGNTTRIFCNTCGDLIHIFVEGNKDADDIINDRKKHEENCCGFWRIDSRGRYNDKIIKKLGDNRENI